MDKYDRAYARHRQKKRKRRTVFIICACSIALGYVLGNLSCLALVVYLKEKKRVGGQNVKNTESRMSTQERRQPLGAQENHQLHFNRK